ncbi:MAG: hypothetical protein Q7S64_02120, partial [bacterium]|nr:hypothetical protein [bacterium]
MIEGRIFQAKGKGMVGPKIWVRLVFGCLFLGLYPIATTAAINNQIQFSGALVTTAKTNVANGNYNFKFELYHDATGGSAVWSETYDENNGRVSVTDGLFSVSLGSHTDLSGVDFDNSSLYLQVYYDPGNDGTYEESFATRIRLTATPYAFNSTKLGGKTESAFGTLTENELVSGNWQFNDQLRFGDDDFSNYVGFQAPSTVTSNLVWTLPAADGSSGQFLKTNGSGALSWAAASGVAALDDLTDVTVTAVADNELLAYDTATNTWVNQTAAAGLAPAGNYITALTGDVTATGPGSAAATIANGAVSLAKMADMATASFLGRNTAGTGSPEVLSVATAKTLLNLSGSNTGDQTITLTGGVTGSGTGSFAATVITNANLTGPITSVGNATAIASQTGTGSTFVMDTSPTLVTPALGAATYTTLSGGNITDSGLTATRVTFAGAAGILQDSTNMTFDTTNGLILAAGSTSALQLSSTAGTAAGGILFGADTNLYRSGANVLKTDDSLVIAGTSADLLAQADLRFYDSDSSNYVGLQSPATVGANIVFSLPATDGGGGQCLSTDGVLNLTWAACGGGSGAPTVSQYVTLALDATLTGERVLTGTANQIILADGGANGNIVLSTPQDIATTSSPTFAGLALGTGNLTMTGSLGATGARLTKGWFTDLEVTNAIVGSVTGSSGSTTGNAATVTNGVYTTDTGTVTSTMILDGTIAAADLASGSVTAPKLQSAAADLGAADVTVNFGNTNGAFSTNITTDGTITATTFIGALTGTASNVTTNANLTGPITSVGNATAVASQTGTGSTFVMQTSPTLTTPILGVATATSIAIGANTLDTTEWANLDGLNQTLATTSSPQFVGLTLTGTAALDGGITVDTNNFTVSGTTGAVAIVAAQTTGTTLGVSYDVGTQTGALTGLAVDFTNITTDATNALYGIKLDDAVSNTASIEYGIYQAGTNWDYGAYFDDLVRIADSGLVLGSTAVTSTAAELNYLDGTVVTAGGVIFGNGTYLANSGAGNSGELLTSAGAGTPTWTAPSSISAGQIDSLDSTDFLRATASDTYEGSNDRTLTIQSALTAADRTTNLVTISQANDVTFNQTAGVLLNVSQADTGSSTNGVYIQNAGTGYALAFEQGTTTADGIVWGADANLVTLYRSANDTLKTDDALVVVGHTTFEGVTSTGATGTGKLVYDDSPTLVTPTIGAATATSIAIGANTLTTSEWANLDGVNQTLATTSSPTFAGLALGTGSLTMTGSLGATGARLTKGWFTDLEVTNAIVGSVTGSSGSTTGNAATVTNGVYTTDTGTVTSTMILDGTIAAADLASGSVTAPKLQSAAADLGAADVTVNFGNTNGAFNTNITTDGTITATTFIGALSGNASTVTTNANLTGPITSVGNATAVASQTGTGSTFVMDTSPTLVTPALGAATYTTLSGGNITDSGLTSGRITYASTGGLLVDSANLLFNGTAQTITSTSAGANVDVLNLYNTSTDNLSSVTLKLGATTSRGTSIASVASGTNGAGWYDMVLSTSSAAAQAEGARLNYNGIFQVWSPTASYYLDPALTTKIEAGDGNIVAWEDSTVGSQIHTQSNAAADPNGTEANATTGWTGASSTLTSDSASPQTGTYALKAVGTGSSGRMEYAFTAKVGALYKISIWAKTDDVGNGNFHSWVGLGNLKPATVYLTGTWTEYVFYQTATATAATIRIYCDTTDKTIYVDNVSIKEVTGGDIIARGKFTGGGTTGIDVDASGATTLDAINAASGSLNALTLSGSLGIFNGSDTFRGLYLNYTNADHTGSTNVFNGIDVAGITGDAQATETAINVGTGWDYGLTAPAGGTAAIYLSDTGGTAVGGLQFGTDTNLYRSAASVLSTDDNVSGAGYFLSTRVLTSTSFYLGQISGEATYRYQVLGDGTINWGDGTNALDTNLYR